MEHRWGIRHLRDVSVRLRGLSNVSALARLQNVSSSGAYIETAAAPALDSRIWVELGRRPGTGEARCRIPAYVVRRDERGVGVEWCEFAPPAAMALIAVPAGVSARREERAGSEAPPVAGGTRSATQAGAWQGRAAEARGAAAVHL